MNKGQKAAYKDIQELVKKSERLIDVDATDIADAFGISFSVGDYGSGRTYYPKGTDSNAEYFEYINGAEFDENGKLISGVWVSSSELC